MHNKNIQNRALAIILASAMGLATVATGCGSQEAADSAASTTAAKTADTTADTAGADDATADTTEAVETEAEIASENTTPISIAVTNGSEGRYINDYNVFVEAYYPYITTEEENYGALGESLDSLTQTLADAATTSADEIEEYARADAEAGILEEYGSYSYSQTAQVVRADSTVVSILLDTYVNQGGAHPSTVYESHTYDSQTGLELTLEDVIQDEQYDQLAGRIAESLANTYDHDGFNCYMDLASASADGTVDGQAFTEALTEDVQAMIDDGTITYTIGQTGITFYFEAYALAIYAAGPQYCTFSYADAPDLVWPGYTHAPANYIAAVGPNGADIETADGSTKSLIVTATSEGEFSFSYDVSIRLDGEEYTGEVNGYSVREYLVHVDGRNYLYLETSMENDWETLYIYDLNSDAPTYVGDYERWFATTSPYDPEHMMLQSISHLLSTFGVQRSYHVGDDGMPVADTDYDLINWSAGEGVTTLQEFTAEVRDTFEGTGTEQTIPAGTTLQFYATDNESWVDFTNDAGQYIRVEVTGDWPHQVNGIDADSLLDGLIYAG